MHLRNTLAKGMDAESYSLHTFEALLSQSMENLGNTLSGLLSDGSLTYTKRPHSDSRKNLIQNPNLAQNFMSYPKKTSFLVENRFFHLRFCFCFETKRIL